MPESQLDMFPDIQVGFVSEKDADGERREQAYQVLPLGMGQLLNATTSGTGTQAGAGLVPQATLFQPQVEGLDQFNGPMEMAMYFNYKVTPGDINPMKWLQFTARSKSATRGENVAKTVTDPTTAEIEIGCKNIAWDGEINQEALMRNYINNFYGAYNDQAGAEFSAEVSHQLTKGDGSNNNIKGLVPLINETTAVPTATVPNNPVHSLAINQVTLLEMKRLISVGLRRPPLVFMARDTIIWEFLINQLYATAPGYSLPLDQSVANDATGTHGKLWGIWLQANEDIDDDPDTANSTIAIVFSGKSICVRTTGRTNTMNVWDEMARDVISTYIRGWYGLQIVKPQVAKNFTVGRLRTT